MTLCNFMADPYDIKYITGYEAALMSLIIMEGHTRVYREACHSLTRNLGAVPTVDLAVAIRHAHSAPLRCVLTCAETSADIRAFGEARADIHAFTAHPNVVEWILDGTPLPLTTVKSKSMAAHFYEVDTGRKVDIDFTLFCVALNTDARREFLQSSISCCLRSGRYVHFWRNNVRLADSNELRGRAPDAAFFLHKPPLYLDRVRAVERLDRIREELIAAAMHPVRLEKYICSGGDVDDF